MLETFKRPFLILILLDFLLLARGKHYSEVRCIFTPTLLCSDFI